MTPAHIAELRRLAEEIQRWAVRGDLNEPPARRIARMARLAIQLCNLIELQRERREPPKPRHIRQSDDDDD